MVPRLSLERTKIESLHVGALPLRVRRAFLYCARLHFLARSPWYLAGGTALALQVGHRQSVDLDFFIPKARFDETNLERILLATGKWATSFRQEGTMYGVLLNVKVSFIAYPFFQPSLHRLSYGSIRILEPADIAAMKIIAVGQRGRKRDFVDLYWYCKNQEPLHSVLKRATQQYPGQEQNINYLLRSLTYFADAEADPMPKIFFKASWREIKRYFQREAPRITRELLGLK